VEQSLRLRARRARAAIESGALRGTALRELFLSIPFLDRDAWIDELLGFPVPPPDMALPRGSVPYLPCGVEEVLAMVRDVPVEAHDELVDLGSGLGRVVVLAHLLSGARARGVEIQEHLVRGAKARCLELGLTAVSFVHDDAAALELDGSIFFLYAPFNGDMLKRVQLRLEAVARRRSVVVCAVGLEFRDVPWLRARKPTNRALNVYDSASDL
jgi:SAM-dependent methyltransferase